MAGKRTYPLPRGGEGVSWAAGRDGARARPGGHSGHGCPGPCLPPGPGGYPGPGTGLDHGSESIWGRCAWSRGVEQEALGHSEGNYNGVV